MTHSHIVSSYHLLQKEIVSEFRTRYALNALVMFVVTTLSMIIFSLGDEAVTPDVLCGLLWIIIFFAAMSGLSRTFVSEEERGTSMTLQLLTSSTTVYIGKLLYNVLLTIGLTLFIAVLYIMVVTNFAVKSYAIFWTILFLGSCGLASASTILAAIIAKANTKGTLFPVLAFPILLPLLLTAIKATKLSLEGGFWFEAFDEYKILVSFTVVMVAASIILFDFVWKD